MLRIALPNKGRLSEEVRDAFEDAGLPVKVRSDRALTTTIADEFQVLFLRAQDIPEFVADGAADAGVTGWDLVNESGRELRSLVDLEFGYCRLVAAARDDGEVKTVADVKPGAAVATCFPRLAARYFADNGKAVKVVPMSGAVEVAPHLGVADLIVDLTSTGSTLKTNGLRELGTVIESSARLVIAQNASQSVIERAEDLATALASVVRARGKRYLMANVPRTKLAEVREVLPGLNGPTVVDVMDGGKFVAVHAVVPAAAVYRTIGALKKLGGEGILVTRIERLMP